MVDETYQGKVTATFTAPRCHGVDGTSMPGADGVLYQLVDDVSGPALLERTSDGGGALITNQWKDETGQHFFVRVLRQGWQYSFPSAPAAQPMRLVYENVDTKWVGNAKQPKTPVTATCALLPVEPLGSSPRLGDSRP